MQPNEFSADWYSIFLDTIPHDRTATEGAFIERHLPPRAYPSLLDVGCGPGRHAQDLANRGYRVLGIDPNAEAVSRARALAPPGVRFRLLDMRDLDALSGRFDGVLGLWHSFGFFDEATNAGILSQIHRRLRPRGRFVTDIFNRQHFVHLPLSESSVRSGVTVHTTRFWTGKRLSVVLTYEGGGGDEFDWRLYTPDEFSALSAAAGFRQVLSCARFDDGLMAGPEHARMQFVFERQG